MYTTAKALKSLLSKYHPYWQKTLALLKFERCNHTISKLTNNTSVFWDSKVHHVSNNYTFELFVNKTLRILSISLLSVYVIKFLDFKVLIFSFYSLGNFSYTPNKYPLSIAKSIESIVPSLFKSPTYNWSLTGKVSLMPSKYCFNIAKSIESTALSPL